MVEVHGFTAEGVMGLMLLAGAWGGVAWLRSRPSVFFWYVMRAAQIALAIQVVLGAILLVTGHEPREDLHLLYGLLPLAVMFICEGMRVSVAAREVGEQDVRALEGAQQQAIALRIVRRETGIMALGALLSFGLILRAAMTAGYF